MSKENISIEHLALPCTCLEEEHELYTTNLSEVLQPCCRTSFLPFYQFSSILKKIGKLLMGQLYFLKLFAC